MFALKYEEMESYSLFNVMTATQKMEMDEVLAEQSNLGSLEWEAQIHAKVFERKTVEIALIMEEMNVKTVTLSMEMDEAQHES